MYGTVLNHTYKGKLNKKTIDVKNPKDYGKWNNASTTHLVCKVDDDDPIIISNTPPKPCRGQLDRGIDSKRENEEDQHLFW